MTLKDRITADMKDAMRARASARLSTLRLLLAAVKQREIDERNVLSDTDVVAVVDKMVRQRRESIAQFDAGHRADLANAERAEIAILETYLPQAMTDAEIDAAIDEALRAARTAGGAGPALMGKVMGALKGKLAGRADMAQVSAKVKSRL
ncbi:MAG TPA: GatB/YqeY domain-containing protein [Casimicrobiaceae bacterium]|nr:GatB/YqeY domain-containing protein [Casimicrobiaceae bacterium]